MSNYIVTIDISDAGNYACLFDGSSKFITKVEFKDISSLIKTYKLSLENCFGIVASIKDTNLEAIPFKYQVARRLLLHKKFLDMPVNYHELVHDIRLVNAYFLFHQNSAKKIIVHTGPFTFVDIIDENGFQGGFTLPSPQQNLSLFKFDGYFKHFAKNQNIDLNFSIDMPHNNTDSLEKGSLLSYFFAIKGIIKTIEPSEIYISGSLGEPVAKSLKETALKLNCKLNYGLDLNHRALCFTATKVNI